MRVGLDANIFVASVKKSGERYHDDALSLSTRISRGKHESITSALLMIELPGALAASTSMPVEKVHEVELATTESFRTSIMPYEPYLDRAVELMLEFRELKRRWNMGSADFHYLATSCQEDCDFFTTTDEKHLLRSECRKALSKYIQVLSPGEAADEL